MKAVVGFERRVLDRMTGLLPGRRDSSNLRRERRRAVRRAYEQFAQRYPRWAQSLFDQYFVEHTAADVLTDGLIRPRALAAAWTRQLRYRDEATRRRHIRQILPVAQLFVRLVSAEMV